MQTNDVEKQQHYEDKIRFYMNKIRELREKEDSVSETYRSNPGGFAEELFYLADDVLNTASHYFAVNGISVSVLSLRNEESMAEARKAITRAIDYVESIVTGKIDAPYSEYENKLETLSAVSAEKKFYMARKMGLSIALLKQAYGNNTKWRWAFVDIEGRFTAVAKNLLDMRKVFSNNDPSSPDYNALLYHQHMIKRLLGAQATKYQERYALASQHADDMRNAIAFLSALRQMLFLLNERHDAEELKKKHDAWSAVYEALLNKKHAANVSAL